MQAIILPLRFIKYNTKIQQDRLIRHGDKLTNGHGYHEKRGFEPYSIDYARSAFRGKGFNLVMYSSGKLVLQGKKGAEFVTFTIEPQITQIFSLGNEDIPYSQWFIPHAGLDESGKGNFFGPIVTACMIAGDDEVCALRKAAAKDGKTVASDRALLEIERKICNIKSIVIEVMALSMAKYRVSHQM